LHIKNARAAVTAFSAQVFIRELIRERNNAVREEGNLHLSLNDENPLDFMKIRNSVAHIQKTLEHEQKPGFYTLKAMASPKARSGHIPDRQYRPPALVCRSTHSQFVHVRSPYTANYLPVADAVLQWACKAPDILFRVGSRLGRHVALPTVVRALQCLSLHKQQVLLDLGTDESRSFILRLDNVPNFLRQRDPRYGRVDHLKIGCAGHIVEAGGFTKEAVDATLKQKKLDERLREKLTIDDLTGLIEGDNAEHLNRVFALHWLLVLVRHVPQLRPHRVKVDELFRTIGARLRLSANKSKIHPLATNAKNETIMTELYDILRDFLQQLGEPERKYLCRLIVVGGDGLTYQKLIEMKRYLQQKGDAAESLQVLEPILELWHTQWTNISRTVETHWGELTGENDPSTLGHSAAIVGRKIPANMKKVDFYLGSQLLNLVLDTRMIDIWCLYFAADDIFEFFERSPTLPTIEQLYEIAKILHRRYSSMEGYSLAMDPMLVVEEDNDWHVPHGTIWSSPPLDPLSMDVDKPLAAGTEFRGDQSLAQSILLIRDSIIVRKTAIAVADGDIGRAYESLKLMLFYFNGSSHKKYGTYLLEQIVSLEYESHDALQNYIKQNWIVKLNNECIEGDLLQEHMNKTLDDLHTRSDAEWNGPLMRNVISLNTFDLMNCKKDITNALGLERKSGRHHEPHTQPEARKLLDVYRREELHSCREGRKYRDRDPNDFARGLRTLANGKLSKWQFETSISYLSPTGPHQMRTSVDVEFTATPDELDDSLDTENDELEDETEKFSPVDEELSDELIGDGEDGSGPGDSGGMVDMNAADADSIIPDVDPVEDILRYERS
ncbi:hypothetical protein FISHEDRAFT_40602, partial [Fistulina hepatica ATCC 64428]